MDAIKKSHEIQLQVRNNAEDFRNTLKDLYNWEKEMKEKEQNLICREEEKNNCNVTTLPVRSHFSVDQQPEGDHKQKKQVFAVSVENNLVLPMDTVDEKNDTRLKHEANMVKDLGNKYVKLGAHDKAIQEYSKAINLFSKDPVFYTNRALCYLKLERYNECIEDCEQAIEIDSLSVKAYYRRMQANECMGNHMDALKDCTTVLMIEPKNSEAIKSLERINERLRNNAKSTKGPNFTALRSNMIDILPVDKPPYKRSNKPLRQVPISDVIGPKESKNCENSSLRISDEDIDKLFNSNCGPFVEVKKGIEISRSVEKDVKKEEKVAARTKVFTSPVQQINQQNEALSITNNQTLPAPPTTTAQFYSNWKELAPHQKYKYIKSINIGRLCKILGAGFDSDTLADILHTLRDFYLPNKDETTSSTLLEVSKNSQVTILSLLMSAEERKIIMDILNTIKENKSNAAAVELIAKNFDLR